MPILLIAHCGLLHGVSGVVMALFIAAEQHAIQYVKMSERILPSSSEKVLAEFAAEREMKSSRKTYR
jgi:hypothetical protein